MSSVVYSHEFEMIRESWQRCYAQGFLPTDSVRGQVLSESQIRSLQKDSRFLLEHAIPVFNSLFPLYKQAEYIAVLTDCQGTIIHAVSTPQFQELADSIYMRPGANWLEDTMGTNAMGVTLREKKPVLVYGEDHFYQTNHFLACAASPIFNAQGELIGAVNISCRIEQYTSSLLPLVTMLADTLQNRLLLSDAHREHLFTLRHMEKLENEHPTPLLTLDNEQRIVRANRAAERIIGRDCLGKEFRIKEGYVMETISDHSQKLWRSIAIRPRPVSKQKNYVFDDIFGTCPTITRVKQLAVRAASMEMPLLLSGESGTGKELFAQSIHSASARSDQPFIAVNCSAIPEDLVESELFGYERGAFTGAKADGSIGKFEAAHNGTLFLDEIGDMSLRAQAALLRAVQEKVITPVGSVKSKQVNVRIIAATHKHLPDEIRSKRFREDLYYRLKGIQLTLPPLRKRSDIGALSTYLLRKIDDDAFLSHDALSYLHRHSWPGNVRELNSILSQAAFLADGGIIEPMHLQWEQDLTEENTPSSNGAGAYHRQSLEETEKETILRTLDTTRWNISRAAQLLQVSRNTLYRKLTEYGFHRQ
ncbi:sigma-54-dependent Fis family transcriptional regulator [Brevibacillus reuszeri]|uniref:Sigma-54-dependent Fis family transcriptional regulator n=2 Tax=Brevibacillus reuszeri TaxID=54915 RepID=A0ABQ0TMU7_9BACL|nr:sigma-54-dependent Fis family transcriptional regulator [Brevibacillus reuszeri]MED1858970.1 sigma-54-dependent Fis family transcriptional regulator [Brevibacillus reuszeri]GED69186.1 sigma-54-dependent Fis family transcriptional regulator [Brevibacillus reuszeri]